jgi:hypothetical protein
MLEWTMALPWWNRTRELRHVRVNKDTTILLASGLNVTVTKNSLISPVRKAYLPRDHRFSSFCDETVEMIADTGAGFGKIQLVDIDM